MKIDMFNESERKQALIATLKLRFSNVKKLMKSFKRLLLLQLMLDYSPNKLSTYSLNPEIQNN